MSAWTLPLELVFGAEIEVSNFGVAVPVFGTFQPGLGAADAALIEQDEITFGIHRNRASSMKCWAALVALPPGPPAR